MKPQFSYRITLLLSFTLLLLVLPSVAQNRSRIIEKKVPPKGKLTIPDKEGTGGLATITPPTPSLGKGVKEPSLPTGNNLPPNLNPKEPAGNQTGNNITVNEESFKAVTLEIQELLKDDAKAKPSSNLHERLVPVVLKWKGKAINQGKLVELEALLETVNIDGTKSRVTKKIIDFSVDKLLAETIILPMKEGTFARDFKLTLSGKCASGEGAKRQVVAISASKQGSFPVPNVIRK